MVLLKVIMLMMIQIYFDSDNTLYHGQESDLNTESTYYDYINNYNCYHDH